MPAESTRQTTGSVLMVRPARFYANPQTAADNRFQSRATPDAAPAEAAREFDRVAAELVREGVDVHVFDDDGAADTPDSIYPNNWFSTHAAGADSPSTLVLYPLAAENRRRERKPAIVRFLRERYPRVIDLTAHEREGRALEGTGSLVLDHASRVAYAGLSGRTDRAVLASWAREMQFEVEAFEMADADGQPIYHTNVMLAIGAEFAVVVSEAIHLADRQRVLGRLRASGRDVIELGFPQMLNFCANVLELRSGGGGALLALSAQALAALEPGQRQRLEARARLVPVAIPTIERVGGGGVRCMLAELF